MTKRQTGAPDWSDADRQELLGLQAKLGKGPHILTPEEQRALHHQGTDPNPPFSAEDRELVVNVNTDLAKLRRS